MRKKRKISFVYAIINKKEGNDMNILVLDDEKEIADLVELYLKNENYQVYKFYTAQEAIRCIDTVKLDLAILDVMVARKKWV